MSIDDQVDVGADQFKWEVYTEMLEVAVEELSADGIQSRFVRTEGRKLLGDFYGINSTENYPFLQHYMDFWDDGLSSAGTLVHELSHNVLTQLSYENQNLSEADLGEVEKAEQLFGITGSQRTTNLGNGSNQ